MATELNILPHLARLSVRLSLNHDMDWKCQTKSAFPLPFIHMPRSCKTFKHDSSSFRVTEQSKTPASGAKGCSFESRLITTFLFQMLRLLPVPRSSAKLIQIKLDIHVITKMAAVYMSAL